MNIQPNAYIANVVEVTLYDRQTRLLTQTDPEYPTAPGIDVATTKNVGSWDITVGPDHSGPQLKYLVADLYSDAAIVRTSVRIRRRCIAKVLQSFALVAEIAACSIRRTPRPNRRQDFRGLLS